MMPTLEEAILGSGLYTEYPEASGIGLAQRRQIVAPTFGPLIADFAGMGVQSCTVLVNSLGELSSDLVRFRQSPAEFDASVRSVLSRIREVFQAITAVQVAAQILIECPNADPQVVLEKLLLETLEPELYQFRVVLTSVIADIGRWLVPGRIEFVLSHLLINCGPLGPKGVH